LAAADAAVAVKPAVMAPAVTVAEAGTLSAELFEERFTTEPPLGAAGEMVKVQMELAPETTLEGEHCMPETAGGVGVGGAGVGGAGATVTPTVAALPFRAAERVAD